MLVAKRMTFLISKPLYITNLKIVGEGTNIHIYLLEHHQNNFDLKRLILQNSKLSV